MNELKKTYPILNRLEELNKCKFNSSNFISLNKDFQSNLDKLIEQKKAHGKINLTNEDKKEVFDLISKIEYLEAKISPKADLMNSFSRFIK